MSTEPNTNQDTAAQNTANGQSWSQKTFLGKPLGSPIESFKKFNEDGIAIMRAKRCALADALPRTETWSDLLLSQSSLGRAQTVIGLLKTDFTKGTFLSNIVGKGTEALNSGADAIEKARDGKILSGLDDAKNCISSVSGTKKAVIAYAAAPEAAAIHDVGVTVNNTIDIATDRNKRNYAIVGDMVTNKNAKWIEEMKNDLKHAGDPMQNSPQHSSILDVKIPESMKRAAANAITDYIVSGTGLKTAAEERAKQPARQIEPDKFDHFLEQAADVVEKAHTAGETMWQSMPDDLRSRIEARHSATHDQQEPEVETTPVAAAPSF
ncbi:MAG: hypothetical protein IKZ87_04180 [Actinomycetaceae bacterium]|nr:hypothetical protein [Actinomycetaceae bacterium]